MCILNFRSRRAVVLSGFSLLAPAAGTAQIAAYDSPAGWVEVMGLHRWTLAMLRDSIRRYVPGHELHDAACMVMLREKLHFAEASVSSFENAPPGEPARSYLTIKVVEPRDRNRVRWDVHPRNQFSSLLPDYAGLILPITDSVGGVHRWRFLHWLQRTDSADRAKLVSDVRAADRPDGERVYAFLDSHRSYVDRQRALNILRHDGLWVNRMVAAAVLSNFPESDSTWWALARALRDPHEAVRQAAGSVLAALPARTIDWQPVTSDLRLLLGGTNLPEIENLFELLARTNVSPTLASPLLRGNADWVLDHIEIERPMAGPAAHRLLVQLHRGIDLGSKRRPWAAWAARF